MDIYGECWTWMYTVNVGHGDKE